MFCENCGELIDDNISNCPKCGMPINNKIIENPSKNSNKNISTVSTDKFSKKKIFIIAGVITIVIIFLILIIAVSAHSNSNIDDTYSNNIYEDYNETNEGIGPTIVPEIEDQYLAQLDYLSIDDNIEIITDESGTANTGESYTNYMYSTSPYQMISYRINGNYDSMSALWCICQTNKDTKESNAFNVYVDNELVYSSPVITGGDLPQNVNIDLNFGNLLTIVFTEGSGCAELGNIVLSCTDATKQKNINSSITTPEWLTKLDYLNKDDNVSINNDSNTSNIDTTYAHIIYANADDEEYGEQSITYYLNGKYSNLSGLWSICTQNKDTEIESKFVIYADDEKVYESKSITSGSIPEDFSISINNCKKLTITFKSGDGSAELGNLKVY